MRPKENKTKVKRTRSTTMIEIVKPPADSRLYRVVILPNGVTAMLISDTVTAPEITTGKQFKGDSRADLDEDVEFVADGETCFFFVCRQASFVKALNIFAQFFISPLFNKNSVDREIMAVDNECHMMASMDSERVRCIMSHELVEVGHPMKKFMAGNKKTLKDDPEMKNMNVYEKLHAFNRRVYSGQYMTLVLHSMDSLDVMEENVIKIFSKIPNNEIPQPKFIKPPFQEKRFNKLIKVVPIEDTNKMDLIWALPPLMEHYRARVIEFLSLLLGHEGKGSILSLLRKNHLALEIVCGNDMTGFSYNSTWSSFLMSIKLTDQGMKQMDLVLDIIYQYIKLIKEKLPVHVFEEQKHIEETKYIFTEQESIYSYVEELAENMHLFPPEHYLCGRHLYFEYNEQLIYDCLDFLHPQAMLILLYNKSFINIPRLQEEPWLGTLYYVSDLPSNPDLQLPMPNPYIATNFTIVKGKKATKLPVVLMDEKSCRMWFKKDNKFHSPCAYVYFTFITSAVAKSTLNLALGDVFLTCILQKLTETLYNATLAGYEYSVEGTPEGVVFVIGGYSEKIKLVIEDTLKAFTDMRVDEDDFQSVITHLKQVYINELIKPVELARAVRHTLLESKDPSLLVRYDQISNVTYPMVEEFIQQFHSNLYVEGFITGNLKPQDAIAIGHMASQVVKKPLSEREFPKPTAMELPVGHHKCFVTAINKEDTNSCVVQYFQQGLGTIFNLCLNDVLGAVMSEPLFNYLRTEKQLGYSIYCSPTITHGVLGFQIVVESQSDKFSMTQVDEVICQFLQDFGHTLKNMSAENFNDVIQHQINMKSSEDADLFEESTRHWQEILKHSYLFECLRLEYAAMQQVTQKSLVDWYDTLISDQRRQLSVMVEGCTKAKCKHVEGKVSDCTTKVMYNILKSTILNTKSPTQLSNSSKTALLSFEDHGPNYITDIDEFKARMKPFPPHVITK